MIGVAGGVTGGLFWSDIDLVDCAQEKGLIYVMYVNMLAVKKEI